MGKILWQAVILLAFFTGILSFRLTGFQTTEKGINDFDYKIDPSFTSVSSSWADSILETLSLEEKIAQSLMVAAYSNRGDDHIKEITSLIEKYHIGGIVFFQGSPVRQANMTNQFQRRSKVPLLVAIDGEWGLGMRLDSTISYPRQMSLGAIRDDDMIYQMGYYIGTQLKRIGVHVNFAPVADVNNNPLNPVINFRSFGEDRRNVANKSLSYSRGLEDAGVIATMKHFPGHGDTNSDSHYTLPVILHNAERLDSIELYPFKYCISNGVPALMTAHLNIPALDSTRQLASSLSYPIVTELLKEKLQFKGLIFTDALNMKGVSDYFKPGELETMAYMAGNDILLMPSDVEKAISNIKREVRRGNISEEEIDTRCRKILMAKKWAGLDKMQEIKLQSIFEDLNSPFYQSFRNELIRQSLTVTRNRDSILPIRQLENTRIAALSIGNAREDRFVETLNLYTKIDPFYISKSESYNSFRALSPKLAGYNTLIISIHETNNRPGDNYGISQQTIRFLNDLDFHGKVILCIFGNPYSLALFDGLENVDAILVAYENNNDFKHLAAQGLFGAFNMNGTLPVSSDLFFQYGTSVDVPFLHRLSYGLPEEVMMNSGVLDSIEVIVNAAIAQKAMPGCQVLVARHGKIVYHKGFGYHSYDGKKKVSPDDLYDLASITKIAATVPYIMKLHEEGIIDINESLGKYLTELDTTDKGNLSIIDILTHQAGLQSWIPFYYSLLQPLDTSQALFSNRLTDEFPLKLGNNLYVNRNVRLREGIYSDRFSAEFPLQVADRMYLNKAYEDTVYHAIINSPLNSRRNYLYSDLGMFFLHRLIEEKTGQLLYPLLYNHFYSRLGATTMGYLPLNRFPKEMIVPTENDIIFRNQILQGHVHDPGAAMLGGVAGHAGLFSNANDLAKVMQMFLNEGIYGGESFISDSVISQFTDCTFCKNNGNRRGIGFDKPEPNPRKNGPTGKYASLSSYGHSGFTGTIAWVDPQYNLVYIFLSNRIHPDQFNQKLIQMNIRTKIQDIIYSSLIDRGLFIN